RRRRRRRGARRQPGAGRRVHGLRDGARPQERHRRHPRAARRRLRRPHHRHLERSGGQRGHAPGRRRRGARPEGAPALLPGPPRRRRPREDGVGGAAAMPIPADRARSFLARQVGTLALSHVHVDSPMALVRSAMWFNAISRLGIHLPLFLVHDLGLLLTTPRGPTGWSLGPRRAALARIQPPPSARGLLDQYLELLRNVSGSEVVEKVAGWRLRDELVAVLLCRALGDAYNRWRDPAKAAGVEELPLDVGVYGDLDPAEHFRQFDA